MSSLEFRPEYSPEIELLLLCARTPASPEARARTAAIVRSGIDWNLFLILAERNEVAALVADSLSAELTFCVPAETRAKLVRCSLDAIAQHHYLAAQLLQILDWLSSEQIEALPLKGPALAAAVYPKAWLRKAGDLDILVPQRQAARAKNVLLARGFRFIESSASRHLPWNEKHFLLMDGSGKLAVELHWHFHEPSFSFELSSNPVFASARSIELHHQSVPFVAPEYLLLLLSVHGARHGWESLKWICDIAELLRRQPFEVMEEAIRLSKKLHCYRMLALAFRLSEELLDAPSQRIDSATRALLEPLVARVKRSILTPRTLALSEPDSLAVVNAENFCFLLRCREGFLTRLRLTCYQLVRCLYPNHLDRAFLRLPAGLSFLYWCVRPIRLLRTYGLRSILATCALFLGEATRTP